MKRMAFVVCLLLSLSSAAWADSLWKGTWILREASQKAVLTMTLEEVGSGWKVTYKVVGSNAPEGVSTIVTQLDGKDAPLLINGKPSGETMGIKKIDSRHTITVLKFEGKEIGISKSELLPDDKVIKTENDYVDSNPGGPIEKQIQYWDRQ